jgi:hypothetical protein
MGEAKRRKAFEEYQRKVKQTYTNATDKEIGEGFMRGEWWRDTGVDAMVIHPPGEPTGRREGDKIVSATYGDCKFKAYVAPSVAAQMIEGWGKILEFKPKPNQDDRSSTKSAIVELLLEHRYVDGNMAAILASAIVWLAKLAARRWVCCSRPRSSATCTMKSPTLGQANVISD